HFIDQILIADLLKDFMNIDFNFGFASDISSAPICSAHHSSSFICAGLYSRAARAAFICHHLWRGLPLRSYSPCPKSMSLPQPPQPWHQRSWRTPRVRRLAHRRTSLFREGTAEQAQKGRRQDQDV